MSASALEALSPGQVDVTSELSHPVLGRRHPEGTTLVPSRTKPSLSLEALVELHAVEHHRHERGVRPQLADDAGGVPCRAA